jgi:hypothetical protein
VKEDLFPPVPQPGRFVSLAVTRAANCFHLTTAIAALLLFALQLCRASGSLSLAWDADLEPNIAKYKVYSDLRSGVPSEPFDVGNVTTATIAPLNKGDFHSGSVASTIQRSRQLFFGPKYGLSITH